MVVRPKIVNQYSKYDDTCVISQPKPTKAIKPIVDQTWQTVKQVWLVVICPPLISFWIDHQYIDLN